MDGIQLAALYTLQHDLARDAEELGRVHHRDITLGGVFDEAIEEFFGDPDLPRRARGDLLTGDEAVVEPTVDRRGRDAEDVRGLSDVNQLTINSLGARVGVEARDVPVSTQIPDAVGREAVAVGGGLALPVEDPGNPLSANMTETLTPLGITVGRWRFNRWQQRENRWH